MLSTQIQLLNKWETKTGFKILNKDQVIQNSIFSLDNGFMEYKISKDRLIIKKLYGNGKYWINKAKEIAVNNNVYILEGYTTKNLNPILRAYKFKITNRNFIRIYCVNNNNNEKLEIKFVGRAKNNKNAFRLTLYLNK